MSKRALKSTISLSQDNLCAISSTPLPLDPSLIDTDRITPKVNGGIYTPDNTRIVNPVAHMVRHGNLRERESSLDEIKSLFDDRVQTMKMKQKVENQIKAYERRTDHLHPETLKFLKESLKPFRDRESQVDKELKRAINDYDDPLVRVCLKVPGLAEITVAALTVYIDLDKAPYPSSLWKYAGLHTSSHSRYQKGVKGSCGNGNLRLFLWRCADSMMKNRECLYRDVYDRVKSRLEQSEKITTTRNTEGKMVECAWKNTKPSHRHGAALRAIMKHLLTDYWVIGRKIKGLPSATIYAEGMLGHEHITRSESRGWDIENTNKIETEKREAKINLEAFR